MRIPNVFLMNIGCVFDAFLCVLADLSEHMLSVLLVGFSGTEGGSDFVNTFWILRESFLRPEKKTSILTHIAVYERSGLGHRK